MKEGLGEPSGKADGPTARMVGDPALRIWFDERECVPISIEGAIHTFVIPQPVSSVRITSRIGVARVDGNDERRLGIAIGRIVLRASTCTYEIPIDHPMLEQGFHRCEREGSRLWRWSDGVAHVPVALLELDTRLPRRIEIHVHGRLPVYEESGGNIGVHR